MPQAGFEPAPERFLRPPPLPLGYCGPSLHPVLWAGFEPAPTRLSTARLCRWATRATAPATAIHVLREGIEPSTSAFGGPRSDPVELPQRSISFLPSSPGRIRTCNGPVLSRPPLPNWATGPIHSSLVPSLHRAGLEPASVRLKAGGSTVELSVRRPRR